MLLAVANALGKYPHDVAAEMTIDQIVVFHAYLEMLNEAQFRHA